MSVDRNKMIRIAQQLYITSIRLEYGEKGVAALLELLEQLPRIYDRVDPEYITGRLLVFRAVHDDASEESVLRDACDSPPVRLSNIEFLPSAYSHDARKKDTVIQVCHGGDLQLWRADGLDTDALARHGLVYVYRTRKDYFRVNGTDQEIPNPDSTYASVFAIPTFRSLNEALECYKWTAVRTSQCEIFSEAWDDSDNIDRLFFKNGPEHFMQRSLAQYLSFTLRGTEVRREQNVDESHPVDIKVTWSFSKKLALIEIKWLGKSRNDKGNVTKVYSQSRALDGAQQLADYLDDNRVQTPTHETKGYLVIVDGRRRGLSKDSISIDWTNGMYYEEEEIRYDPKHHEIRVDFEEPVRMFVEPKCR